MLWFPTQLVFGRHCKHTGSQRSAQVPKKPDTTGKPRYQDRVFGFHSCGWLQPAHGLYGAVGARSGPSAPLEFKQCIVNQLLCLRSPLQMKAAAHAALTLLKITKTAAQLGQGYFSNLAAID
jgi:hypothetical protein